jgi:hypothetical protein
MGTDVAMTNEAVALLHRGRSAKRHEHRWDPLSAREDCIGCGLLLHDYQTRQRRNRNNRKRGGRTELAVARTYGGEKVGPLGLPEDVRGKSWRTQVKVSQRSVPPMWQREFDKMATQRDGRTPRLILRFTRSGGLAQGRTQDFIVIRGSDWLDWFGRDE